MKDITVKLLIVAICLVHQALAIGEIHQVMESLNGVPEGWKRGERPSPYTSINFRLALNQSTVEFQQAVIDISTPAHPKYGQHMTREEMRELLHPEPDTMNNVVTWLISENVAPNVIIVEGSWITFQIPLAQAERMLKARYFYYHDVANQNTLIRTLNYSIPETVHSNIALIQPTTRFGHLNPHSAPEPDEPMIASPEDLTAECGFVVRPDCLRDLYDIKNASAKPDSRNRLGISGFLEQFARHNDFYDFMNGLSPKESDANFSVVRINDGLKDEDSPSGSTEASLDIQYAISLAYDTSATFYTTGGRGPLVPDAEQPNASQSSNEPYLEQLHYLINLPDEQLPAVLTTSYGESEQTVPASYATAICDLYSQLGARVEIPVSEVLVKGMMDRIKQDFSQDFRPRAPLLPPSVGHTVIDQRGGQASQVVASRRYSSVLHIKMKQFRVILVNWVTNGMDYTTLKEEASPMSRLRQVGT
ncbi:unnamed protein product [Penicillium pancosmium]